MSKESAAGYRANLLTPRSTRAISPLDKKTTHSCTKTTYFRQKQSSKNNSPVRQNLQVLADRGDSDHTEEEFSDYFPAHMSGW